MASMKATMESAGIAHLPASVELADFDPTSTAVWLATGGDPAALPEPGLRRTFDDYWDELEQRLAGKLVRESWAAYEIRIADAWLRLGQGERAHHDYCIGREAAGSCLTDRGDRGTNRRMPPSKQPGSGGTSAGNFSSGRQKPLGQLLKEMELVTEGHIQEALIVQRKKGGVIGEILVELGYVSKEEILLALAAQMGMEVVDLDEMSIDPAVFKLVECKDCGQRYNRTTGKPIGAAHALLYTLVVALIGGAIVLGIYLTAY